MTLGSCFYSTNYVFAQTDQSSSKLQAANTAVALAFNAVLAAEKAGANVTNLIAQLNTAAGILAQAENSYRTGDYNATAAQADSVLPIAQEVTSVAQNAKQKALVSSQNAFWQMMAFTAIGASVFLLVLFSIWRRFKQGYIKSFSGSKPVVNNR